MHRPSLFKAIVATTIVASSSLLSIEAQAAAASATTTLFSLTDSSGLLTFSNNSYLVEAQTPIHDQFGTGSSPLSFSLNDFPSSASAAADADGTFPLDTSAGVNAGLGNSGRGAATAAWYLDWQASATGTVTLDLNYLFSYTVANLLSGETGIASSYISVLVDGTQSQADVLRFYNNINGDNSGITDLFLTFNVTAGQKGSLSITAASNAVAAPVPLPAGLWLLGSGIVGLAGLVRRKRSLVTSA